MYLYLKAFLHLLLSIELPLLVFPNSLFFSLPSGRLMTRTVVNKNVLLTDEICMTIINLKVIDFDRLA